MNESKLFICQEDKSNKFWRYERNDSSVTFSWGRIGLKGQSQTKAGTSWSLDPFIEKKIRDKMYKGYRETSESELQFLVLQSEIIGTQHKVDNVELFNVDTGHKLTNALNPDVNIGVRCRVNVFKSGEYRMQIVDNDLQFYSEYGDPIGSPDKKLQDIIDKAKKITGITLGRQLGA